MAAVDSSTPASIGLHESKDNIFNTNNGENNNSNNNTQHLDRTWREKLVTKEDFFHIHKICGILFIISVTIRFCMPVSTDLGFISHPQFTIPTVLIHFLLGASSFQFLIPNRRIVTGDRIWPESRIHAQVFTCRSLANIMLIWYERTYNIEEPNYDWNLLIVLMTLAFADWGSYSVGAYHSNSIRDVPGWSPYSKFLLSASQFFGTSACLVGFRRCSVHYGMIFAFQWTPFTMTLRRKNIFPSGLIGGFYMFVIFIAAVIGTNDLLRNESWQSFLLYMNIGQVAVILRLGPRIPGARIIQNNKYLIWLVLGLFLRKFRSVLLRDDKTTNRYSMAFLFFTYIITTYISNTKSKKSALQEKEEKEILEQKQQQQKLD